jgi:hypothetical protein
MSDTETNTEAKKKAPSETMVEPPSEVIDSFEAIEPDFTLPEPEPRDTSSESDSSAPDSFADPLPPPPDPVVTDLGMDPIAEIDPITESLSSETSNSTPHLTSDFLDEVKSFSETIQGTTSLVEIFVPYHLYLSGTFGPYERDKLLLFITENEIGLTSQELDLQIQSGKVLFPRISEFAGIKIIQELRDSGLQVRFHPSERDMDETRQVHSGLEFHFDANLGGSASTPTVRILSMDSAELTLYREIETLTSTQYLRANLVEVESSDLFQELLDRMTDSIKQRARIKGADALYRLQHHLSPLRLPSQYQVTLQAILLKKK